VNNPTTRHQIHIHCRPHKRHCCCNHN